MSAYKVYLFGPPRIEHNNKAPEIQRRKTLGLFIYLVASSQPHSRDSLATLFWPDNDQSGARANLRRDISRLKKSLGDDCLVLDGDNVSWNPDLELWLDIKEFQSNLDKAASHDHPVGSLCPGCSNTLADSINLYTDDFLAGFSLPDSSEFDEWQFFQAEGLRRSLAETLQKLIDWHTSSGGYEQAITYARRWLALDNLHEPAHQTLMRLYFWAGEQASALRQYQECARLLREKLKLDPDENTRKLYKEIKSKRLSMPEKVVPETSTAAEPALKGFPLDVSQFIGREKEIVTLVDMLQREETRLVTIVALGGMGKTRLSVETGKRFIEQQADITSDGGVFFPLASVDKVEALPYALAKNLGISLAGQIDPLTELVNSLKNKRMLLVLDNFEQLVEGAPLLQDLLSQCPGIKMLVSSREPLRLSFEYRVDLDGLPYPQPDTPNGDEYESVNLFLQSARRVRPDFQLNAATRPLVYQLCARLAGIPLAIKLAANWLRAIKIDQIVTEVERSLDILTSQLRDIPERQHSMNAVFESTWRMLSTEEQRAFASLSVFRGGFFEDAAHKVAEVSPYLLAGLVDHGLVRFLDGSRYEVHELTRQFAAIKSAESEESCSSVPRRHSEYYLGLVKQKGPSLYGQSPQEALQVLKIDLDNIRFAWDWAVENLSLVELKPVIEPLTAFYEIAGFLAAGEQAFWSAIQRHEHTAKKPVEKIALFTLLMHYALFLVFEGRWVEAEGHLEQIEDLAKDLDDEASVADAYQIKGLVFHHGEKKAEALELFRQAVEIYRKLDRPRRLIYSLNHMGEGLSYLLKPKEALRSHEEALEISQRIGEKRMQALSLSHMGVAYYYLNELDEALRHWEQAAESFEQVGDVRDNGRTRNNLSYIYNRLGQYEEALQHAEKALEIMVRIGDRYNEANASDTLGEAYYALGNYEEARRCFESALEDSLELQRVGCDPAIIRTHLAQLEISMGKYTEAEKQLDLADMSGMREAHPKDAGRFFGVQARLYDRTVRREKALDAIEQGIALLRDAGDQIQTGELLVQKAALLLADGKTDQAESFLKDAQHILQKLSIPSVHFEAQLLSARILHAQGKIKEANRLLKDLHNAERMHSRHAAIHYTLWEINRKGEYARVAHELYQALVCKTPNIEYQERLEALGDALHKAKVGSK